jgi:hypothetical protein
MHVYGMKTLLWLADTNSQAYLDFEHIKMRHAPEGLISQPKHQLR